MPGLLQGIALFVVACVIVYGLVAAIQSKHGAETAGNAGGHDHH